MNAYELSTFGDKVRANLGQHRENQSVGDLAENFLQGAIRHAWHNAIEKSSNPLERMELQTLCMRALNVSPYRR